MAAGLALGATGCERANVDPATVDAGAIRNAPPGTEAGPSRAPITLEGSPRVLATPAAVALQSALDSGEPAGVRIPLPEIRFVGGQQVREDPNGSIATLAAILRAHPSAQVRVEVARPTPQRQTANGETARLAELVEQAFIRNGVPADQISSAGALTNSEREPLVRLAVIRK